MLTVLSGCQAFNCPRNAIIMTDAGVEPADVQSGVHWLVKTMLREQAQSTQLGSDTGEGLWGLKPPPPLH